MYVFPAKTGAVRIFWGGGIYFGQSEISQALRGQCVINLILVFWFYGRQTNPPFLF
jgi:hypothetical protein